MLNIAERENVNKATISHNSTVFDALSSINDSGIGVCLVCDAEKRVVGLITDGDIRRGFLSGISADSPVNSIAKKDFYHVVLSKNWKSDVEFVLLMHTVRHLPVLNEDGTLHELVIFTDCCVYKAKDNPVVIMAGGLGERLRPLTESRPKPLLSVGSRPLLERIIAYFRYYGFRKFYISLNYLGDMISDYFKDGSSMGVHISYLRETQRMGTAGSLSLLPKPSLPFIVTNGDLIMNINLDQFMAEHIQKQFLATMCVWSHSVKIQYGVVNVDKGRFSGITEKPNFDFLINTGLYCLNPEVIDFIPEEKLIDMPNIFDRIVKENGSVGTFRLNGKWIDIGTIDDYNRICRDDVTML